MRYCITEGRGIGLVTGEPGTGKSLVCRRLAHSLADAYATAIITNTNMTSVKALLQAILYDLDLPFRGMDEQDLRLMLTDHLLGKHSSGGRTVLLIDEAQNLSLPLFEELRMLGNLEGDATKLVQIVLFGHSRLGLVLRRPELETFNQRIGTRATIAPLGDDETCDYITHQLCAAGAADEIFTHDAMSAVYEATGGVPRLINQLCERAMLLAYVAEAMYVESETVEQASTELEVDQAVATVRVQDLSSTVTMVAPAAAPTLIQETPASHREIAVANMQECDANLERAEPMDMCHESHSARIDNDRRVAEPAEAAPSVAATVPMKSTVATEEPTTQSAADDEEIIDRYAMMDAARALRNRKLAKTQPAQPPRTTEPVRPQTKPTLALAAEAPAANGDKPVAAAPADEPEPSFVDADDNPAVHEVGAGVVADITPDAEPPILLIEPRSVRSRDNSIRIDQPQSATERAAASNYRRLFSNARKN
jgi:type II secretory pathway predicted ATPase ExeA